MDFVSEYRDAIKRRDELDTTRHQRNALGFLAALGWLLAAIQGAAWLYRN